ATPGALAGGALRLPRSRSLDLDGDRLLGRGGLGLGDVHAQYAILALGANALRIDALRQREGAGERAVEALDADLALVLLLLLVTALATDGEHALLVGDLHVLLLDLWQLHLDQVLGIGLAHIGQRTPLGRFGFET